MYWQGLKIMAWEICRVQTFGFFVKSTETDIDTIFFNYSEFQTPGEYVFCRLDRNRKEVVQARTLTQHIDTRCRQFNFNGVTGKGGINFVLEKLKTIEVLTTSNSITWSNLSIDIEMDLPRFVFREKWIFWRNRLVYIKKLLGYSADTKEINSLMIKILGKPKEL